MKKTNLRILTGCSKIDIQMIEALIDYTQMSYLFRVTLYRLERSKITAKEYEYLDKYCYSAYMNNEYQDYLETKKQEEGICVCHREPKKDKRNHNYYIKEFGFRVKRPYEIIKNYSKQHVCIRGKQGKIYWVEPVMSFKEFEKEYLGC